VNKFVKAMCFIGGANLDILEKCPTEKNGFIATGIGIINVVVVSIVVMCMSMLSRLEINVLLSIIISLFYGFVVFIGYWGILSVIRKTAKYGLWIKLFSIIATALISFVASNSMVRISNNTIAANSSSKSIYVISSIIFIIMLLVYLLPIVIKLLINSTTYEEERDRMEHNFITQKEADIIAYREKYKDYAVMFNDANVKMESIKHLSKISKAYHNFLEEIQHETFDFLNKLEKITVNEKDAKTGLLLECKVAVEEQFSKTLEKMAKIFDSI
jgi:hypothetical protein